MEHENDRLLRLVVGALLSSTMKDIEIVEVSRLLANNSKFSARLGVMLRSVVKAGPDFGQPLDYLSNSRSSDHAPATGVEALFLETIARRRYSRERVSSIFRTVSGGRKRIEASKSATMRELVSRFVEAASEDEIFMALKKLGVEVSKDPFLGGIGSRKDF